MPTAEDKIRRARTQLLKKEPFFANLALRLIIKPLPQDAKHKTMAVDALGNMFYDENFVNSLNDEQLIGVVCHETLHVALQHLMRLNSRDLQLWNIATDLVINHTLQNNGYKLPQGGLVPINGTFEHGNIYIDDVGGKIAERIYDELKKQANKQEKNGLSGAGFDEHIYGELNPQQKEALGKEWTNALVEAAAYAKLQGKMPKGFDRFIDDLAAPKMNWRSLLYRYIVQELPYDYSWQMPSKRSHSTGVYMPSMVREKIDVVVAIDTSGSIDKKGLTEFLSEIVSIGKSFQNIKITCLICDCEVKDVLVMENGNIDTIMNTKIKGGGGTSFQPVIDYINDNMPNAKLLIYFTDGYGDEIEFPQRFNIMWALCTNGTEKYICDKGLIVRLEE